MDRNQVIEWLRDNTIREQWRNTSTLFFVGATDDLVLNWRTTPYTSAEGVCVKGYGKNENAEPIHYSDVFKQPVFIDGAEYWLKDSSGHGETTKVRYMVGTNTFYEVDKPFGFSAPASDFGRHFTVELVSDPSIAPVKPESPSLYDRVGEWSTEGDNQ